MRLEWITLEYISVNRKHIFKLVALCKVNAIHMKTVLYILRELYKCLRANLKRLSSLLFLFNKYKNKKVYIKLSCNIDKDTVFEGANAIYPRTSFSGRIGYGSYIGQDCNLNAYIGRFTSIAPRVNCNWGIHPINTSFVSLSPMFFSTRKQTGSTFVSDDLYDEFRFAIKDKHIPVVIGNDCWIGEGAFLVGGITVNDGAVVLADAVVTKDVPPYSICGGVPAKVIGYRYDENVIKRLLEMKWWDKDISWIQQNHLKFRDINILLKDYGKD